ncbi:TetR/AcrR family transcriptional regulator [Candidatus Enterococcus mansonii]|uniref:HTH tetR-type domain-containing protein n=1 Tax=Candidatus Enterococcus mansonii TaxID=1834181 RepID=A0A242CJV4_9ENTE|nr:TetR/AcrR family transcriptional regulator [Enterococcus sp. 4G2_DIV0659]OTO10534.1 hypothetical protein A5880_001218 [Enterococcus sp. 4G2_DIV0659]
MVRKKVYTKEHILSAAQELLVSKGFSFITARNVADHMGISTQPIYLEFKNMEDLKLTMLNKIHEQLEKDFFSQEHTGNSLIDFGMSYLHLAKENSALYLSLYSDKHSYGAELQKLSLNFFKSLIGKDQNYLSFSDEQIEATHMKLWIIATGIASLSMSGIMQLSEEELFKAFNVVG